MGKPLGVSITIFAAGCTLDLLDPVKSSNATVSLTLLSSFFLF